MLEGDDRCAIVVSLPDPLEEPPTLVELKRVERVFHNPPARLMRIHIGGQVIRATHAHRFWVHDRDWVPAEALAIGDQLRGPSGELVQITDLFDNGEVEPVYNLRVADHHTYFVATPDRGQAVLAHNAYIGPVPTPAHVMSFSVSEDKDAIYHRTLDALTEAGTLKLNSKSISPSQVVVTGTDAAGSVITTTIDYDKGTITIYITPPPRGPIQQIIDGAALTPIGGAISAPAIGRSLLPQLFGKASTAVAVGTAGGVGVIGLTKAFQIAFAEGEISATQERAKELALQIKLHDKMLDKHLRNAKDAISSSEGEGYDIYMDMAKATEESIARLRAELKKLGY